jgi:hypothetical protein
VFAIWNRENKLDLILYCGHLDEREGLSTKAKDRKNHAS